jgi:sugar O-acyltransferase (sialic acid O-acetyltransferase NeuD family)
MTNAPVQVLIFGAGQLALDIADMIAEMPGMALAGFIEGVDRTRCRAEANGLPIHWIGDIAPLAATHKVITAIGDTGRRAAIESLEGEGFEFACLIHPTVYFAPSAGYGVGTVCAPGSIFAAAVALGDHVFVNRGALVGHHTEIGGYCTIGPGANIAGRCSIGAGCFIGIGAVIVDGITLGAGCYVTAGAVVTRDFPEHSRLAGFPARAIRPKG